MNAFPEVRRTIDGAGSIPARQYVTIIKPHESMSLRDTNSADICVFMPSAPGTDKGIEGLLRAVRKGSRVIALSGMTSTASKAAVLTILQHETGKPFVVVSDSNTAMDTWAEDLRFWTAHHEALGLPANEADPDIVALPSFETDVYSGVSPHAETLERRAIALWQLARGDSGSFVVVSPRSLLARTVPPGEILNLGTQLELDAELSPELFVEQLAASGYVREDPILNFGQFSLRGGIVDVWSPDAAAPIRVEFFGDNVDSIREFDPDTQLSTGKLKNALVAPMREFAASAGDFRQCKLWSSSIPSPATPATTNTTAVPTARTATRSGRPSTTFAIALPNSRHRRVVGSGGRYTFTKTGTTGILRPAWMNSNGATCTKLDRRPMISSALV